MRDRLAIVLAAAATVVLVAACGSAPVRTAAPPEDAVARATPASASIEATAPSDVLSVLVRDEKLSSLSRVLKGTGLTDLLAGRGPYTVFAPDDAAFAKLEPGLTQLMASGRLSWLSPRLRYHVVAGSVPPAALRRTTKLTSVTGETIAVTTKAGRIVIDGSASVEASHSASTGWVYRIDRVLAP